MHLPHLYEKVRENFPTGEVKYGCGGIKLLSAADFEDGQVGYSIAPDGTSLCDGETGSWQPNWFVIGHETICGDPLFVDVNDENMPVFTAMHGESTWEPNQVSASLDAFVKCVREFSRISVGRSNPIEREANPLTDDERIVYLRRIAELNGTSAAAEFWDILLEA